MRFLPVFKVVASVTLRAFAIYFIFAMHVLNPARMPVENIQMAIAYSLIASVGWEMADFFSWQGPVFMKNICLCTTAIPDNRQCPIHGPKK